MIYNEMPRIPGHFYVTGKVATSASVMSARANHRTVVRSVMTAAAPGGGDSPPGVRIRVPHAAFSGGATETSFSHSR
jgi:hypothetical protein